jgi:hypothetical protein
VQISRSLQRCLRTCAHGGAGILRNEIDAQPSDNGASVVFVQTVKGKAVVEQRRRLKEYLTSHLEVDLGPCLRNCLRGCQELIEWWVYGAVRHTREVVNAPASRQANMPLDHAMPVTESALNTQNSLSSGSRMTAHVSGFASVGGS